MSKREDLLVYVSDRGHGWSLYKNAAALCTYPALLADHPFYSARLPHLIAEPKESQLRFLFVNFRHNLMPRPLIGPGHTLAIEFESNVTVLVYADNADITL